MCARPASELWAAGFRDVCRPWACACGDAHPMGQPGGACFSPPSHRTSRLRAEPTRTPHVLRCYHPCRTCCASPRPRDSTCLLPTAYTPYAPAVHTLRANSARPNPVELMRSRSAVPTRWSALVMFLLAAQTHAAAWTDAQHKKFVGQLAS